MAGHSVLPCAQPPQLASTLMVAGSGKKSADKPLWQSATAGAAQAGAGTGASSGDESCDDTWQSNWGLDLFSALNPSVITTGGCYSRAGACHTGRCCRQRLPIGPVVAGHCNFREGS